MIVRDTGSSLELIRQPDHAHLARRVMERCVSLDEHPRRASVLHAIGEHDNGWAEEDDALDVDPDSGEVLDFIHAPIAVRQRVWPRAVSRLSSDRWAAALVAQHALTAYDRFRQDPEWREFFDDLTTRRDALVDEENASLDALLGDYVFVRIADLISLGFCLGRAGEQQFADYTITAGPEGRVTVSPGIFGGALLPLDVRACVIPHRPFVSAEDLHAALNGAEIITLRGEAADG